MQRTITKYRKTTRPCLRCKGDGIYRNHGICFRCRGAGCEMEAYEAPMTADELRSEDEYSAMIARREARAAARRAAR